MQAYLPTYMTVFVAWINFWMDPKELATRATLAISAFLAMCLQLGNVQQNQPRVSYVKAMDVWMLGSISFLFTALIELAIISYMLRTDKQARRQAASRQRSVLYVPPSPSLGRIYECDEPKVVLAQKCTNRKSKKVKSSIVYETVYGCPVSPCPHEQASRWSKATRPWDHDSDTDEPMLSSKPVQNREHSRLKRWKQRMVAGARSLHAKYANCDDLMSNRLCTVYGVDKFFLIIYPPAYVFFNIVYYAYYLK